MKYQSGTQKQIGKIEYFIPNFLPSLDERDYFVNESYVAFGESMFALGKLTEIWSCYRHLRQYFVRAIAIKEILFTISLNEIKTPAQILTDLFIKNSFDTPIFGYYNVLHSISNDTQLSKNSEYSILDHETIIKFQHALTKNNEKLNEKLPNESKNILNFNIFSNYRTQSLRVETFIPPHPSHIVPLMDNLIKYINVKHKVHPLIVAIIAQAQFEMIYPFVIENTRTGFLVFLSSLIRREIIPAALIPINCHMLKIRTKYCAKLDEIVKNADLIGWINFLLENIAEIANNTCTMLKEFISLHDELSKLIETENNFFKMRSSAKDIIDALFFEPASCIGDLGKKINKSYNATHNILEIFIDLGIVKQSSDQKRNKVYIFQKYLNLLKT